MSDELMRTVTDILLPACPQCGSRECGPFRCRMSGITHGLFRENRYAEQGIRREKEQPKWLGELKTGARDE